jgi:2-haloacid dehalogenase
VNARFVVFDAYGTLFDVASVHAACAGVVPRPLELVRLWRAKQLEYSFLRSLMGPAAYVDFWTITGDALEYATEALGLDVSAPERERMLGGWLEVKPFAEVEQALDALQRQARACVILSNGTPFMLHEALRSSGLAARFQTVLSVESVRVYKPDPRVYRLAVESLGASLDQLVFVSSNGWDAAGAAAFGLRVAWINRSGAPTERLGFMPRIILRDLTGVAGSLAVSC